MSWNPESNLHIDASKARGSGIGILIALVFIIGIIFLRLRDMKHVDKEELAGTYNNICHVLDEGGDFESLYDETKRHLRHASMEMEVHFLYEFVRRMNGEEPIVDELEPVEIPIRQALHEQRFEDARAGVREAVVNNSGMKPGRGQLWLTLIEKLELRANNDCDIDF